MTLCYIDSSVWVKRYCEESGSTLVEALFSGEDVLACSGLGLVEVTATLSRKHRAAEISLRDRDECLERLEEDWQGFVRIDVIPDVVAAASRLARDFALRGSDAVHLASALSIFHDLAGSGHRFVFASSDYELKLAAGSLGLAVFDPEQPARP